MYILGGTSSGRGNYTLNTEYNFRIDPEAVSVVINLMPEINLIP